MSRGLGDVYKRQVLKASCWALAHERPQLLICKNIRVSKVIEAFRIQITTSPFNNCNSLPNLHEVFVSRKIDPENILLLVTLLCHRLPDRNIT